MEIPRLLTMECSCGFPNLLRGIEGIEGIEGIRYYIYILKSCSRLLARTLTLYLHLLYISDIQNKGKLLPLRATASLDGKGAGTASYDQETKTIGIFQTLF